jgi:hypothetical protein
MYQNTRVSSAHPAIQGELKVTIRKHGIGDHTLGFLEQVQAVVYRIGNAVGLMRMLAAGCTRYSNSISRCVQWSLKLSWLNLWTHILFTVDPFSCL